MLEGFDVCYNDCVIAGYNGLIIRVQCRGEGKNELVYLLQLNS